MDQQQPETITSQPLTESAAPAQPAGKNKRKILALWLLISPTALIIGSIILYAIANFILSGAEQSAIQTILNVTLFLIGAISVMTWLPGIIVGIILLTTQKKS